MQPPQPAGESFQQRRARLDRQELAPIFNQPHRHQRRAQDGPYSKPEPNDDLANMVFQVEDVDPDGLPKDWQFRPETGFFELRPGTINRNFWEIKSGCLLRHHVHPRKTLFDPHGLKDIPIPVEHLDNTRVTVHRTTDGQIASFTDDFKNPMHFAKDLNKHQLPAQ
eukprot:s3268_g4.t1